MGRCSDGGPASGPVSDLWGIAMSDGVSGDKEGVALASGHHIKCEALHDDGIGIRHGNPGHGATWIYDRRQERG